MSSVEKIEKAIETLPREQFYLLHRWVQRRFEDEWERQIEDDSLSGRLDHLAQEALSEYRAGFTTPFPPDEKQGDT